MDREITGFVQDGEGHWVALLSCGHRQHTRHAPPLSAREWVLTEAGRRSRLGATLDCPRCDHREVPDGYAPYRKTPVFDEATMPDRLRAHHRTRAGTWGRIDVELGELEYTCEPPFAGTERLTPDRPGIVVPEVEHRVTPCGHVRFRVTFLRPALGTESL